MSRRFLRQTVSLGVSYTLGTFNDNFFKQGILLLAVSMGHTAVQAWGTVLFSLPFVLFSAWAGWLADRYPKCRLVLAAKALEVCAMLAGGWGLLQLHWSGMLAMLFCMGASATLFSPALNGSLPELFAREDVPRVNAPVQAGHHGLHPAGHHTGRRRPGTAVARHGDPLRALAGGCRGRGRGGAGPALRVLHPLPARCRPQGRSAALPLAGGPGFRPRLVAPACPPGHLLVPVRRCLFLHPVHPRPAGDQCLRRGPAGPWPHHGQPAARRAHAGHLCRGRLAARRARGDWRRSVPRACAGIGLLLAVAGGVPPRPRPSASACSLPVMRRWASAAACISCRCPARSSCFRQRRKRAASSAPAISFPFPAWPWPGRSMPCCPSCRLP